MERELLEFRPGLLLCVAEHRRELRPWLVALFHASACPSPFLGSWAYESVGAHALTTSEASCVPHTGCRAWLMCVLVSLRWCFPS